MRLDIQAGVCALALTGLVGCGGGDNEDLFGDDVGSASSTGGTSGGGNGAQCDIGGTWATFVEVGVAWESPTIRAGAGTTKQWILSERTVLSDTEIREVARVCGMGAVGVGLGSPWFSTIEVPQLEIQSEWTGVTFKPEVFDSGKVPTHEFTTTVTAANPPMATVGDTFSAPAVPFSIGAENLPAEFPDVAGMAPLVRDHDGDGSPGITGMPFDGQVPGEADGVAFNNPRLDLAPDPPRTSGLFLVIRTQGALEGTLVSCDPPRAEGELVGGSLKIESRNVGCTVAQTGEPCTQEQSDFIDGNLPVFEPTGVSVLKSVKVADGTTCAEVRAMDL